MANTNTNEHPPEHTATPAPIEQAAAPAPSEQLLDEAIAINNGGSCFKQSDYSEGTWDAIEHHALPFDDVCTIFPKGTELSIVRDHLDTLSIHHDTKAEILARLAGEMFSEVTFAIACDGEVTFEDDTDPYDWEDICSRDYKIFRPGAKQSEVADYLDALGIKGDHKGHILEMIFC